MILFITMGVREQSLSTGSISLDLLRAVRLKNYSGIIFNIALFIPLGYLLSDLLCRNWLSVFLALLISLSVETLQYLTGRGQFDVDDLICNTAGAVIGLLLWILLQNLIKKRPITGKIIPIAMLCAGLIGCVIAPRSGYPVNYMKQFDFHVSIASFSDGNLQINGVCSTYNRNTPDYELYLGEKPLTTTISDDTFTAVGRAGLGKHELFIKFRGFGKISTGVYIRFADNTATVEYVPGDVNVPFAVPEDYILKAYNSDQSTYVFQDPSEHRLVWYIGWEIDEKTEVIYHIQTNEPEKLPPHRIQYSFDNRGFRVPNDGSAGKNELERIGEYRVFEREIPQEYNVTAVTVGFNTSGTITWTDYFRVE